MKPADLKALNVWGKTPLEWARACQRSDIAGFIERRYTALGIPLETPQGAPAKVRRRAHGLRSWRFMVDDVGACVRCAALTCL